MMVLVVTFFEFLKLFSFWFVVAVFDLVHDVEAIFHHKSLSSNSIWKYFQKYE